MSIRGLTIGGNPDSSAGELRRLPSDAPPSSLPLPSVFPPSGIVVRKVDACRSRIGQGLLFTMSYYRDTYLKSGHWKTLRASRLIKSDNVCAICSNRSPSNDVHHVQYGRSLWKVSVSDLRVLCRKCHTDVHHVQDSHPSMSSMSPKEAWSAIFEILTNPLKKASKERRRINRKETRRIASEFKQKISNTCFPFLSYFMPVIEAAAKTEADQLAKCRAITDPGRDRKYHEYTDALEKGGRLDDRTANWLQCEISRRRNRGLPVISFGIPAETDGPELREFSASPL